MKLSKWHGLGNDYLLVERDELAAPLTPEQVRRICDYHFGVGSDGILEVVSADGDQAELVIWNPDGSTAEMSGNATRIVSVAPTSTVPMSISTSAPSRIVATTSRGPTTMRTSPAPLRLASQRAAMRVPFPESSAVEPSGFQITSSA